VDFKVIICGKAVRKKNPGLHDLADSDYCYAGYVEDIDTYFSGADVFINPITSGGGIKVKLVEALSYGLPVVSTELAAEGIDKKITGKQLLVSPDHDNETFCRLIVASWGLPKGASEEFLATYQWKKIVGDLAARIKLQ
jgi:glycosyltransferase involved in cell wall biosynthesis